MQSCHDMKKDQVYICEDCGLELQVIKECKKCEPSDDCCEATECRFVCCDTELRLKE